MSTCTARTAGQVSRAAHTLCRHSRSPRRRPPTSEGSLRPLFQRMCVQRAPRCSARLASPRPGHPLQPWSRGARWPTAAYGQSRGVPRGREVCAHAGRGQQLDRPLTGPRRTHGQRLAPAFGWGPATWRKCCTTGCTPPLPRCDWPRASAAVFTRATPAPSAGTAWRSRTAHRRRGARGLVAGGVRHPIRLDDPGSRHLKRGAPPGAASSAARRARNPSHERASVTRSAA